MGFIICQVLFQVLYISILIHLILIIPYKGSPVVIPILQIGKTRHGEVKTVQVHIPSKRQNWGLNPSSLVPESILSTTVLYCVSEIDPGEYSKGIFSTIVEQKPDYRRAEKYLENVFMELCQELRVNVGFCQMLFLHLLR